MELVDFHARERESIQGRVRVCASAVFRTLRAADLRSGYMRRAMSASLSPDSELLACAEVLR